MDPAIFKAYDIRGVFKEQFDEHDAWKIGNAAGRFLPSLIRGFERGQTHSQTLVVGHDMRSHSKIVSAKLIEGIRCARVAHRLDPVASDALVADHATRDSVTLGVVLCGPWRAVLGAVVGDDDQVRLQRAFGRGRDRQVDGVFLVVGDHHEGQGNAVAHRRMLVLKLLMA